MSFTIEPGPYKHHLYAISGPAASRASARATLKTHESTLMHHHAYYVRVADYAPPIDTKLSLGGRLHDLVAAEYRTHDPHSWPRDDALVEKCLLRVTSRPTATEPLMMTVDRSAVLRWPTQLRVLVKWCVLLFDWHADLPIYVVLWVLEWTDEPLNWRGTEMQRVDAIQRVFDSRRRILSARKERSVEPTPESE